MRSYGVLIAVLFTAHLATSQANLGLGPLGPFLQQDLGLTLSQLGLLTGLRFLGTIVASIPSGVAADRLPARSLLTGGQVFLGVLFVLMSLTGSFYTLLVGMLLLGIGFSTVNPTTTRIVMERSPVNRRATVMALKQMGVPAGGVLAGALLPWLAATFSWKAALLGAGAVVFASALVAWRGMADGAEEAQAAAAPKPAGSFWTELRYLLGRTDVMVVSGIQTVFTASQFILLTYLTVFLVEVHQYSPVVTGLVFGIAQVSGFVFRLLWGLASDILFGGRRREVVLLIGLFLVAGVLALSWVPVGSPFWGMALVAILVGAGGLAWAGVFILIRAELGGLDHSAASTGLGMAVASFGGLLGPPAFGLAVEWSGSYGVAWHILALLVLVGTLAILRVPESSAVAQRAETSVH